MNKGVLSAVSKVIRSNKKKKKKSAKYAFLVLQK